MKLTFSLQRRTLGREFKFPRLLIVAAVGLRLVAEQPPPVVLTIDLENIVNYAGDTPDVSKLAATGTKTTQVPSNNFYPVLWLGDVVAINGKPAKGTWTVRGNVLSRSPSATPGMAIADSTGALFFDWIFDLMQEDGTPIGSLMAVGTGGAPKPPGSHSAILQANMTVTGGTGCFWEFAARPVRAAIRSFRAALR